MKKIDFHVHIETDIPAEQSAYYFLDMCDRHGYSGINILSFSHGLDGYDGYFERCNEAALELKVKMGKGSCAFGCLLPSVDYARQAESLMRAGFDGIKLLRGGKPSYYRDYPYLYDADIYEEFFAIAEEKQYPIIMHNNDPAYCWDMSKTTERAIKKGWVYDTRYPSHERYYSSVEKVLEQHPRLKLALAHMGFYSENIDRAFFLMDNYPNLYMDITPATNIYAEMSCVKNRAEEFFRKYHDRLIFGTDATNNLVGAARRYNDYKNELTDHFFSCGEAKDFQKDPDASVERIVPISLDNAMLEDIYYNNAMNFIGKREVR